MFLEESEILLSEVTYKSYNENIDSLKFNINKIINKCIENMNKCKGNEKLYRKNCIKIQKAAIRLRKMYNKGDYYNLCSLLTNNNKDYVKSILMSFIPIVNIYTNISLKVSTIHILKLANSPEGKEISRKFVTEYEKLAKRYKV